MSTRPSNRPLLARLLTVAAVAALSMPEASAQSISFSSDFESLTLDDPYALSADGWLVFGNVFNGVTGARLYGYGPFPAPNSTAPPPPNPAFCGVTTGEGGPDQGAQGLVVFSDYNNADHANGHQIESNVYRESPPITAANVGDYVFQFDAKKGDLVAPSTAIAFIKTINPADGKLTNFITLDTSDLPVTWGTYTLNITIDSGLVGQLLQFGFANTATSYAPSGVYYDNVSVTSNAVLPPAKITEIFKDNDIVTVLFETEDGGIYDLEKSPDGLDNFAPVEGQTDLPGDGGEIEAYDEFATEPKAFYRVVRQP